MPFKEYPAKTFLKVYECDDCNKPVSYTGECLTINPPLYTHECKECFKKFHLDNSYPITLFKSQ